MAITRTVWMAALLVALAPPLFQQQKGHGRCEPPPPPPNCPPAACASPGAAPVWPCGALDQRRRELEQQIERLKGNLRAVEMALQNQHGRQVTQAELDLADGILAVASLPNAIATGGGSLAARVAAWAAKELAQKAAGAAAAAGVKLLTDPMLGGVLETMSIEALENLANVLSQARFMANQELGLLLVELAECNAAFYKSHDEWSAKQAAYEACQLKYKEDLAECNRYFRRYHKDCK